MDRIALTPDVPACSDVAMKKPTFILTGLLCLAAATSYAADPQMGTWKLNEAKSKITPGTAKNTTVVYSGAMMGKVKVTVDGTDGSGKPAHNVWTGRFDGQDYAVKGDETTDTRAYTKVDDRTLSIVNKKGGKVITTGRVVVSPDGKNRTLNVSGTTAKGKKFKSIAVYDKA
jgi:hypothetical protein